MMKRVIIIFTLLVSTTMFSSPSYAEWTRVTENVSGTTRYVDFERIRKHDGYVYYWMLSDYLKPNSAGSFSGIIYVQVDCKLFRYKYLSDTYYTGPMGTGQNNGGSNIPDKDWRYPKPYSSGEVILKNVCSY